MNDKPNRRILFVVFVFLLVAFGIAVTILVRRKPMLACPDRTQFASSPLYGDIGYQLHQGSAYRFSAGVPAPTGQRVAFIASHDYRDEEIVVWDPAPDRLLNLTHNFGTRLLTTDRRNGVTDPVWWSDGDIPVIAFIAGWLISEKNVYVASLDGSGTRAITTDGGFGYLRLADDGKHLWVDQSAGSSESQQTMQIAPGTHALTIARRDLEARKLLGNNPRCYMSPKVRFVRAGVNSALRASRPG